ncbi:MAG TPA: class II aldolase/adducin family protein [Anaerolineaceae bacterium]|jgi:L-fuculose-phosphate aldolase|nr:class II aldolase/adducin family protein [Anaerolineaceae bacterium]
MEKQRELEKRIREEIIFTAKQMLKKGYVVGTAGNVSSVIRDRKTIIITPSGAPYESLEPQDLIACDMDGNKISGEKKPSSEILMHANIYKNREDVGSIVHSHSIYATALAVNGTPIPYCLDEMYFSVGDRSIPVAKYGKSGTQELADHIVEALGKENKAVLVRNHGMVAVGKNMTEAFENCEVVEKTAMIFIFSSLTGKVQLLEK